MPELEWEGWDRDAVHTVFDGLQIGAQMRERLFALRAEEPEAQEGFQVAGESLAAGELAPWLATHAPAGVRAGLHTIGRWARGQGDVEALARGIASRRALRLTISRSSRTISGSPGQAWRRRSTSSCNSRNRAA